MEIKSPFQNGTDKTQNGNRPTSSRRSTLYKRTLLAGTLALSMGAGALLRQQIEYILHNPLSTSIEQTLQEVGTYRLKHPELADLIAEKLTWNDYFFSILEGPESVAHQAVVQYLTDLQSSLKTQISHEEQRQNFPKTGTLDEKVSFLTDNYGWEFSFIGEDCQATIPLSDVPQSEVHQTLNSLNYHLLKYPHDLVQSDEMRLVLYPFCSAYKEHTVKVLPKDSVPLNSVIVSATAGKELISIYAAIEWRNIQLRTFAQQTDKVGEHELQHVFDYRYPIEAERNWDGMYEEPEEKDSCPKDFANTRGTTDKREDRARIAENLMDPDINICGDIQTRATSSPRLAAKINRLKDFYFRITNGIVADNYWDNVNNREVRGRYFADQIRNYFVEVSRALDKLAYLLKKQTHQ